MIEEMGKLLPFLKVAVGTGVSTWPGQQGGPFGRLELPREGGLCQERVS